MLLDCNVIYALRREGVDFQGHFHCVLRAKLRDHLNIWNVHIINEKSFPKAQCLALSDLRVTQWNTCKTHRTIWKQPADPHMNLFSFLWYVAGAAGGGVAAGGGGLLRSQA